MLAIDSWFSNLYYINRSLYDICPIKNCLYFYHEL